MKKRLIALVLVLMMTVTLLPVSAFAQNITRIEMTLSNKSVVDEDGYLIPGEWMSDVFAYSGAEYGIIGEEWYLNGVYDGDRPSVIQANSVYVEELTLLANTDLGYRFTSKPEFILDDFMQLESFEVLDGGIHAKMRIRFVSRPPLRSFSFYVHDGVMNENGQLIHGSELPVFESDRSVGRVTADSWMKDGHIMSLYEERESIIAGHEYGVTVSVGHASGTSLSIDTEIIAPKGFTEQWRELDANSIGDLRIFYTVSAEPVRIIEGGTVVPDFPEYYYDDEGVIRSGTMLAALNFKRVATPEFEYTSYEITNVKKYIDGVEKEPGDVITAGHEYSTSFRLEPLRGYALAPDFSLSCDYAKSIETTANPDGSVDVLLVAKPVTKMSVVKNLYLILPEPSGGTTPPACISPEHTVIRGEEWYCVDDGTVAEPGTPLKVGNTYTLRLYLAPMEGFVFQNFDNESSSDDRTAPELDVTVADEPIDSFYGIKNGEYAGCVCVEHTYPALQMALPVFLTNPEDLTVIEGGSATFSVTCEGEDLSYQWYSVHGGVESLMTGETSSVLTVDKVSVSQHNDTGYCCTVSNAAGTVHSLTAMLTVHSFPFTDVKKSAVYYDAVSWAYCHKPYQITGGFDATHFVPNNACTRAQVVTFLWRAMGCPLPNIDENPFKDVSPKQSNGSDNPYYNAILWAAECGITTGFGGGLFKPNDPVTRAQFVTFLWRAENMPDSNGSIAGFTDAGKIASPYQKAVAWAVETGVTTGYTDGTFRPDDVCTRWAVVLFMYRDMK